jgi:uncharacterized cofD-like protein
MANENIVVIGGGTGTYTVLTGLKNYSSNITAIVTMADDGGSSGRLRDEFGHLPPGDARRCLVALSANQEVSRTLRTLFEYRFENEESQLDGHNFGNLFLTVLTELTGSVELAILEASRLLNIRGRVLPVTTDNVRLCATLEDGTLIRGERHIDVRTVKPELPIRQVFLSPEASAYPPVLEAIRNADILVIGPGDLYTSIIPNMLVHGVPQAIQECKGVRIYVCNLMTKRGETDGFSSSKFLSELSRYLGSTNSVDCMIANDGIFPRTLLARYAEENAHPVVVDTDQSLNYVPRIVQEDILTSRSLLRHDSKKLARLIMQIGKESKSHNGVVRSHSTIAGVR